MKRNKLDILFSTLVRKKANYTCERCHKYYPEGYRRGLDCSHYMGRMNKSTRYDPDNGDCLCRGCHAFFEERKQTLYRDWKIEKHGLDAVDVIEKKSREICKITKKQEKEIEEYLKSEIEKLDIASWG